MKIYSVQYLAANGLWFLVPHSSNPFDTLEEAKAFCQDYAKLKRGLLCRVIKREGVVTEEYSIKYE